MREWPRPARRAAALLLLVGIAALGWLAFGAPWLAAREAAEGRIAVALAIEARALAAASRGPALQAEAVALREALSDAAVDGIPGASHALAGAELQRRLRDAVARHGGAVQSMETLPEAQVAAGVIGVRARLQIDAAGLRDLLLQLEGGRTPLQLRNLAVTGASARASRPLLDAQMDLVGLRGAAP